MYCDDRLGERWFSHKPDDADMRVPDDIKDSVCFLCVKTPTQTLYGGTAFVIQTTEEPASDLHWNYLVTARHSVKIAYGLGDVYVRFNTKGGSPKLIKLADQWVYPDSESSDVAVMPIQLTSDLQYIPIDKSICVTDAQIKQHNIGIGDDLLIVGLFTQRHGTQNNIPIVRSGIIASMPDEPLQDQESGLDYNAYLAEVRRARKDAVV